MPEVNAVWEDNNILFKSEINVSASSSGHIITAANKMSLDELSLILKVRKLMHS